MKRRAGAVTAGVQPPALSQESKVLNKLPLMREFLAANIYDDGGTRQPGYITIRNKTVAYEVTLYDPDAGLRLPVRGPTLDDALALAEQLLGVAEAPWEVDRYLSEQLVPKKGRKRS